MPYDRTERIRRAAVLVACLDSDLADQVLAGLPPSMRLQVMAEAEQMDDIDFEEQQDVLAEFRRLPPAAGAVDGVEYEPAPLVMETSVSHGAAQSDHLSDEDAAAMAELLSREHPQVVAAVLTRFGEIEGAAVFAALPGALQGDGIDRLATLAPVDDDALADVESQLRQRLEQRRQQRARLAEGCELVRKLLARTPHEHRIHLMSRLNGKPGAGVQAPAPCPTTARIVFEPEMSSTALATKAKRLAAAVQYSRGAADSPLSDSAPVSLKDRSAELERLSNQALVEALRRAGEATVLRALAASGDVFLARVTNMLPRRQARKLRGLLRNLGPTRLADMHAAQAELLRLAYETDSAATTEAAA